MIRDELFDTGLATRRKMFGRAGAEDQTDDPGVFTDKLQEIVTRWCFGDVWSRPGLGHRERSMITLAMLVALGRPHEIRVHVRGAVANGVSPDQIREILVHAVLYCGLPAAVDGFRNAEAVLAELDAEGAA